MDFIPEYYQKEAVEFIIRNAFCGVFLETAVERTAIVLMALQKLLYDYFLGSKVLIVTSNTSVRQLWCTEIKRWDNLAMLKYSHVTGTEKQRLRALRRNADIYMINIENLSWLLCRDLWMFDTLVLDELGKYRSERNLRYRQIVSLRPKVKRLIGVGTVPKDNKLEDLWAECYLLDGGERLGRDKRSFLELYFFKNWEVINGKSCLRTEAKNGAREALLKVISNLIYCKVPDNSDIEETLQDIYIEMNPVEYSKYHWLENVVTNAVVDNRERYTFKRIISLLRAADGLWDEGITARYFHERKFMALDRFLKEKRNKNILIACCFEQDRMEIRKRYLDTLCIHSHDSVNQWNQRKYRIGIINPFSKEAGKLLAEGTDVLVWYSLPWSYRVYEKLNANVNDKKNQIVRLVMLATVEEQMLLLLNRSSVEREELRECCAKKERTNDK